MELSLIETFTVESKFSNTLEMGGGNTGYMFKIFNLFFSSGAYSLCLNLIYCIESISVFLTSKNAIEMNIITNVQQTRRLCERSSTWYTHTHE